MTQSPQKSIYDGLNELPPELRAEVEAALSKMQSNPSLFKMLSSMGDIVQSARQNGIGVTQIKNATPSPAELSTTAPATFESGQFFSPGTRKIHRQPSPTYNPMVKGDGLRKAVFLVSIIFVVGYLIIKFGYNGQLPF